MESVMELGEMMTSVMGSPRVENVLWVGGTLRHCCSAWLSFISCPHSFSHPPWGPTHLCGHHGMVEQGSVIHKKDLSWFFHQGLEQYCGHANEPGETGSRCEILSQVSFSVSGIALPRDVFSLLEAVLSRQKEGCGDAEHPQEGAGLSTLWELAWGLPCQGAP